jgi:diguanylate cyclase (GGDEF)-like protein
MYLARHDPLTGLDNRSVLLDRTEQALKMASRRHQSVAVLFCDIDGFKQVNDRLGHSGGDAVLVAISDRLRACVRESDTVARLGGDEFAVLLENVRKSDDVDRVSSSVLSAIQERIEVQGRYVTVSTSIGIATSDGTDTVERLLSNADMAMYEAKARGKNRVARYQSELGEARVRRLEMTDALRAAVDAGAFTVAYQPIIDVHSGETVGVEALVRWQHGGREIPADRFMPLAEETGMVVQLGEQVLDIVASDVRALAGLGDLHNASMGVAVNISAQQLRSPAFVDKIHTTIRSLRGIRLVLEVTERDVVREDSLSMSAMMKLVDAGVRFAVDDFGVGFSSIGYLQNLPVQVLKTDQSFVASIEHQPRSAALLRSMILMGQALGLDVVVEGIERQEQLDLVRVMGQPGIYAQGYLLGRPTTLSSAVRSEPRNKRAGDDRGPAPRVDGLDGRPHPPG